MTHLAPSKLVLHVRISDNYDKIRVRQGHRMGFLTPAVQQHGVPYVRHQRTRVVGT